MRRVYVHSTRGIGESTFRRLSDLPNVSIDCMLRLAVVNVHCSSVFSFCTTKLSIDIMLSIVLSVQHTCIHHDHNHNQRHTLCRYLDTVMEGCIDLGGEAMAEQFVLTTSGWSDFFLDDTPTSRRPWLHRKVWPDKWKQPDRGHAPMLVHQATPPHTVMTHRESSPLFSPSFIKVLMFAQHVRNSVAHSVLCFFLYRSCFAALHRD